MNKEVELQKIAHSLEELNRKYDLASRGLKSGSTGVGLGFIVAMAIIIVAGATNIAGAQPLFTGSQIVWSIGILVAGLVAYFALVFSREFKVRTEISENKKTIDLALGKSTG
jgi:hypothetical protein